MAVFEPTKVILPKAYEGQEIKGKVRLVNQSHGPMTPSTWTTSCGCLKWLEPKPIVLMSNQSVEVSFALNTRGMPGALHKELIVELDDDIGIHTCPVECEVVPASSQPQAIKFGPLKRGKPQEVIIEVEPGPGGAEVRIQSVKSSDPNLQWLETKSKTFTTGQGAVVHLVLIPLQDPPLQIVAQIELATPAQVTQSVSIEYEKLIP